MARGAGRAEGTAPRKFHERLTEQACAALAAQLEGAPRAAAPLAVAHLLEWFDELGGGRSGNGSGPNPLAWSAMLAWSKMTETVPEIWELRALQRMDTVWLRSVLDKIAARAPRRAGSPDEPPDPKTLPRLMPGMLRAIAGRDIEDGGAE